MITKARKDRGQPPSTGWQPMVCELHVEDLETSRAFWCDIIGFSVAYERLEEQFVYLEQVLKDGRGAQIMLCQRNGRWETGSMTYPLGQGIMFQLTVDRLSPVLCELDRNNWPIHTPLREFWRNVGDREAGQREIFVQDPDGYLLMLNEDLGERVSQKKLNHPL